MFFLVVEHLLQAVEVLTCLLVQLLVDVAIDRDEFRHNDVLKGVHSAVGHFDLLVQGQERGLKGGNRYQKVQDPAELLSAFLDGESSTF